MGRLLLRDGQWERVENLLSGKSTDYGVTASDNPDLEYLMADRVFQKLKHYLRIATRFEQSALK